MLQSNLQIQMTSDPQTRINLTALQRRDPYIGNILDSATHVAVYTFNPSSGEWEKTEIEGTLFVYSRLAPPTTGFTIMNQLSMDNLTEPLNNEIEFQNQSPFLLYRNSKMLIYGIWFYDMYDCSRIGNLLLELSKRKLLSSIEQTSELVPLPSSPTSTSSSSVLSLLEGVVDEDQTLVPGAFDDSTLNAVSTSGNKERFDIMEILSKAKKDYDKGSTKSSKEPNLKVRNKISKAELFKPVPVKSDSKKVDVASLFDQSDAKKNGLVVRPSSANLLSGPKTDNSPASRESAAREGGRHSSRSMSLSLSHEQFQSQHHSVLNGAICVEDLESPVMGKPAPRNRYSSVNDSSLSTHALSNPSPAGAGAPLQKLISKTSSISLQSDNLKSDYLLPTPTPSLLQNNSKNTFAAPSMLGTNRLTSIYAGSASISIGAGQGDPLGSRAPSDMAPAIAGNHFTPFSTSNASTSVTSLGLPPLHENLTSPSYGVGSMPNSHSLPQLAATSSMLKPPLHVAASLHGIAGKEQTKLLSPSALQLSKSSQIAASLLSTSCTRSSAISPVALDSNKSTIESKSLISPEDFEHPFSQLPNQESLQKFQKPSEPTSNTNEPMNKNQLAEVLCALLQGDSTFLDTVHRAYLSGFSSIQKRDIRINPDPWQN